MNGENKDFNFEIKEIEEKEDEKEEKTKYVQIII